MCVTSKAAIVSLIWSFNIAIICGLASQPSAFLIQLGQVSLFSIYLGNAISLCFYPLAGYIADNVAGRYKIILNSLKVFLCAWIMAVVLVIMFTPFLALPDPGSRLYQVGFIGILCASVLFNLAMNISFIGFNANIIQFGMEQLHDSPAHHQSLFIYWYVLIYYLVQFIIVQPWNILHIEFTTSMTLFGIIGVSPLIMIIISLCVTKNNKNWFLINPARVNPYKLVHKITRFTKQHKVPIRRSAFTYWEDDIPTGLDLAKTKYGGPFTTEDVENVKAFFGILKILWSFCPVFFFTYAADLSLYWYIGEIVPYNYWSMSLTAYHYFLDDNTLSSVVVIVLISVYLLLKFWKCHCTYPVSMLRRLGLSLTFLILTLLSITVLNISFTTEKQKCFFPSLNCKYQPYYNYSTGDYSYDNFTVHEVKLTIRSLFPILPRCLYGISNALLYTALYEFICAQSPPSMKGLLIGLSFGLKGIFQALGALVAIPFGYFPNSFPSCAVWYYGINTLLAIMTLIIFTYYARKYKYRERDEICNIYHFAEKYYSKLN